MFNLFRNKNKSRPNSSLTEEEKIYLEALQKPRIIKCPGVIVTYRFNAKPSSASATLRQLFDPGAKDQEIRDIFIANPSADLAKLQEALGIILIDVQVPAKPDVGTNPEINDDVFVGEDDPDLKPPVE